MQAFCKLNAQYALPELCITMHLSILFQTEAAFYAEP